MIQNGGSQVPNGLPGRELLDDPFWNKGTAFSAEERLGEVPPCSFLTDWSGGW
jgi:hypothetical protein